MKRETSSAKADTAGAAEEGGSVMECLDCGSQRILTAYTSELDGRAIDEVEVLVDAIDHISHYAAALTDNEDEFAPGWFQHIAMSLANLAEMLRVRTEQRERESKPAAEAQQ